MNRPEFVPLMKRSAGSIACHAAIISRELGKPCIIGTKNASQMIKDGDLVEVDAYPSSGAADNGVARIVKSIK